MSTNHSFPPHYRLKSQKLIAQLFQSSSSAYSYPLLLKFQRLELDSEVKELQVAFSVPKKKVKLAVQRNRIRRLIFEAFRTTHREILPPAGVHKIAMIWIYLADSELEFDKIKNAVFLCLQQLKENLP
ncbi:MAG: ribonuclease P protein component [Saprospiraceae bacterium]|nr:ribonuclease P protein component [Saprospiraceae bacterium]